LFGAFASDRRKSMKKKTQIPRSIRSSRRGISSLAERIPVS